VTELCQRLRPDVITMDVMMPVIDGVAATQYIMAHCATPILMVSSSTSRGQVQQTFDALAAGAIDVLEKPSGAQAKGVWERELVEAVKLVSHVRPITRAFVRGLAADSRNSTPALSPGSPSGASASVNDAISFPGIDRDDATLVAIGASTGGPAAIATILFANSI
jgi:two-component system, chemotaxis family, protein-glutamate methylesterase/glutaminase